VQAARTAERWETLVRACADPVLVVDGDATILLASPSIERLLGYGELPGRSLRDLLHPGDRPGLAGTILGFLADVGVTSVAEWRLQCADGEWLDLELTATNLLDDPTLGGVMLTGRDVTERNRTFRALQDSRRRLEAVLDIAGALIVVTDLDDRVVLANRPDAELLGTANNREVLAAGRALQFEEQVGTRHFLTTRVPVLDADGHATGVCAVGTDVTERFTAEAERAELEHALHRSQRMESLGQLAGGVAHDFNNLLAVIINYADFVTDALEPGHAGIEDMGEIRRAAERAAALTKQLLVFCRHDHLELELVDVNEVAVDTARLLDRTLGAEFTLTVMPAAGAVEVRAARVQLEQVLMNLVINARDATDGRGSVIVTLSPVHLGVHEAATRGVVPGRHVRIDVADDGPGMPRETIERAFEPFFTTKPKGRGTGLGLATAYGIVTGAGGHIEINSETDAGTTVTMHLPLSEDSQPAAAEAEHGNDVVTVMIVEDEDAVRTLTRRILEREGYTTIEAADPAEGLVRYAELSTPPDLVLSDVVMPGMSGKDMVEQLRERVPEQRALFMSAYTDNVMDRYGLAGSADLLLNKPFDARQLLAAVQTALAG
jgi:PAS domain S-box-containing protein